MSFVIIPSKYITVYDSDPVWMKETMKSKIQPKNVLYKDIYSSGRFESVFISLTLILENLITELREFISPTETLYYENLAKKLNSSFFQEKTYWTILKTVYFPLIKNF